MRVFKVGLFTIGLASFGFAGTALAQTDLKTDISLSLQAEQRDFISRFSGALPYKETKTLSSRSSRKQRAIAADILVKEFKDMNLTAERHTYSHPNIHFLLDVFMPPLRGQNIISHIPATTQSKNYIVIGAHYDSVLGSPGANDNASGVAISLSIAKALTALENRNSHFLIVFFDQEEDGSAGSLSFVRKILKDNVSISSMHNIDMAGWDGDNDRTIEVELPTEDMENIYRSAARARNVVITRTTYNSSDHIPFREVGIDAVCISEEYSSGDYTPHYHKPSDKAGAVDFEYMASTTLVLIDVMTTLAQQP